MQFLKKFLIEEEAQDLVEYGLVLALVVVGGATAYGTFGTQINTAIAAAVASIEGVLKPAS